MASSTFSYGYLEASYLFYPYSGQTEGLGTSSQVERFIVNSIKPIGSETIQQIADNSKTVATQNLMQIVAAESQVLSEVTMKIDADKSIGSQVERKISNTLKPIQSQNVMQIGGVEKYIFVETDRKISTDKTIGFQVQRQIAESSAILRWQVKAGTVVHNLCEDGGYLALDYMDSPYLVTVICGGLRSQVYRSFKRDVNTQVRKALYNTTNLRILWEFPSRGDGTNWTSNSTAAGDYSPNNVNSDIVEQIWKSDGDVAGVYLICDAGAPVFVDTLAILNHNFTTSASILFQGSNDPGFSTIGTQITIQSTRDNIYYIAPSLPTLSYRYWKISIDDATNADGFLFAGTIIFGSATIFQGECFVDQVIRSTTHFSDKISTEGFTNVANDRAIKNATSLEFRSIRFNRGNYNNLREIFEEMRTSLKALWIPTPQYPSRFAVFGKLTEIPQETHNVKGEDLDFVNFQINVDESL